MCNNARLDKIIIIGNVVYVFLIIFRLIRSESLKSNAFLGIPRPAGKGARVIIIGMGNQNGWIPNSAQVWKRTAKDGVVSGDYHSDINAEGFEKWLKECLPNLPPNR